MAKPVIQFNAVPYNVNGHTGYRPSFEGLGELQDLDFCKEVVNEKRLQTSPDQLLHDIRMLAEVATAKVAEDGRARGITKLIKWHASAKGNLESPTSAWNDTCKAKISPQLLSDSTKEIDATFVNASEGIGVKLNYVAWPGAQTVINVVKIGKAIIAYGNHMEFLAGDTAVLLVGTTPYTLSCTESDVAHAVFSWPTGCAPEAGTQAEFIMKSRGGIEEGEVYTSKKTVTVIAADPTPTVPTITTVHGVGRADGQIQRGDKYVIEGAMLDKLDLDTLHGVSWYVNGVVESTSFESSEIESKTATQIVLNKTLPDNADIGKAVTLTLNFVEPYESKTGSATVVAA